MALPLYGCGAYPYKYSSDPRASAYIGHAVGGPIGGDKGYLHYYSPNGAEVINDSTNALRLAHLQDAMKNAGSGDVIWVPSGMDITHSGRLGTLKEGAILASDRGQNGNPGAKLTLTGAIPGTYENGFIVVYSRAHVSGFVLQGPSATSSGENCAVATVGADIKSVEVENCWIDKFNNGGFFDRGNHASWNGTEWVGTHYIHHSYIAHCQRGGMGYGVSTDLAKGFFWVDCCIFRDSRHHTAIDGYHAGYEASYCDFGDAWNDRYTGQYEGDPQHQVDWHGGGSGGYAASISMVHHCTMSANDKYPGREKRNCLMRGKVAEWADLHHNWTKKTDHSGVFPKSASDDARWIEKYGWCKIKFDQFSALSEHEGGSWGGTNDQPKYNLFVHDNWWGTAAPPGDDTPPELRIFAVTVQVKERMA
jgi:hypothetical protein